MVEDDDVEKCVQIHDAGETGFLPLLSTKATGEGRGGHSRSWHTHAGCMQCKRLDAQKGLHLTNISLMRYPRLKSTLKNVVDEEVFNCNDIKKGMEDV